MFAISLSRLLLICYPFSALLDDLNKATDKTDVKLQAETKRLINISNKEKAAGQFTTSNPFFFLFFSLSHFLMLLPSFNRCPLLDCSFDHCCGASIHLLVIKKKEKKKKEEKKFCLKTTIISFHKMSHSLLLLGEEMDDSLITNPALITIALQSKLAWLFGTKKERRVLFVREYSWLLFFFLSASFLSRPHHTLQNYK
jgi:hypothetical protein